MTDKPATDHRRRSVGDHSLALGLAAVVCVAIPVVGDFIAVPAAVLAIVCGLIGIGHYDAGRTSRVTSAAAGAALGALALVVTALVLVATHLA